MAEIKLIINNSSSRNYPKVIKLIKGLGGTESSRYSELSINLRELVLPQLKQFKKVFELSRSWRSRELFINGEEIDNDSPLYSTILCYETKLKCNDPEAYCYGKAHARYYYSYYEDSQNIFGCIHCGFHASNRDKYETQYYDDTPDRWELISKLLGDGTIEIHKEKILERIEYYTNNYFMCPALNLESMREIVANLPDKLDDNYEKYEQVVYYHKQGVYPSNTELEIEEENRKAIKLEKYYEELDSEYENQRLSEVTNLTKDDLQPYFKKYDEKLNQMVEILKDIKKLLQSNNK